MKNLKKIAIFALVATTALLLGGKNAYAVTIDTSVAPVLGSITHDSRLTDSGYPELFWDYSGSAYNFKVYRNGQYNVNMIGDDRRYSVDSFAPSGYNTYTVTAVGDNGESLHSNPVTIAHETYDRSDLYFGWTYLDNNNIYRFPNNKYWVTKPISVYFDTPYCSTTTVNSEGQAYPSCTVTGADGMTGHVTLPIKYDATLPQMINVTASYTSYKSQGTTYYNVTVKGKVIDNNRVICNDYTGDAEIVGISGATGITDCETKVWTANISNVVLPKGNNLIRATPIDSAGNRGPQVNYTLNIK